MYLTNLLVSSSLLALAAAQVPAGQIDCQGGPVNPTDLSNAQNQLHEFCKAGKTIRGGVHVTFTNGSTTAYMCNYANYWAPCSIAEVDDAFNQIGAKCGFPNKGGDYWISQWGKTYGYQVAGQSICDNGAEESDSEGENDDDEGGDDDEIDDWGMLAEEDDGE